MRVDEIIQRQLKDLEDAVVEMSEEELILTDDNVKVTFPKNEKSYIVFKKPNMEICAHYLEEMANQRSWREAMKSLFKETLVEIHIETSDGRVLLHATAETHKNLADIMMKRVAPAITMWASFTILSSVSKALPLIGLAPEGQPPVEEIKIE